MVPKLCSPSISMAFLDFQPALSTGGVYTSNSIQNASLNIVKRCLSLSPACSMPNPATRFQQFPISLLL